MLRKLALYIFSTAVVMTASAVSAAGLWDDQGIALSRAGLALRQPSPFISILTPSVSDQSWKKDGLDETRRQCVDYQPMLRQVNSFFRQKKLTDDIIYDLVADRPVCLVEVFDSERPELAYPVLLTPTGDFVFGYDSTAAYTPWSDIDHVAASFDAVTLDFMTTRGIAPAGSMEPEMAESAALGPRIEVYWPEKPALPAKKEDNYWKDVTIPVPTFRPDPTTTGSTD